MRKFLLSLLIWVILPVAVFAQVGGGVFSNGASLLGYNIFTTSNVIRLNGNGSVGFASGTDPTAAQNVGFSILSSGLISVDTSVGGNSLGSIVARTVRTNGFTVSTLPAGTVGMRAYVTDQSAACVAAGAALTGGGAVTCPVFYNGTAWVGD